MADLSDQRHPEGKDAGTVGISQVPDTSAGNNMRIRVPLRS